jgi:hypothetical protein
MLTRWQKKKNANMAIRGMGCREESDFFCEDLYRMMTEVYESQREDRKREISHPGRSQRVK